MPKQKPWKRLRFPKGDSHYKQLWRIIDGAVADAFAMHPEYLTKAGQERARQSIVKRVTGAICGYEEQSSQGRSVPGTAARNGSPRYKDCQQMEGSRSPI